MANGALNGIHVLDCSQIIAAPLCSTLLAETGADVVKVEPLEGEPWRLTGELMPKESRVFTVHNRSKRGVSLDLKRPEAAPIRERLIRWADVLVTNYRPGVAGELGLDYDSVRALQPNIIYAENSAFGGKGPEASRRGYDIVAQAMSGLATANMRVDERGTPVIMPFAPADVVTGCLMAWGVVAALYHRARTGESQRVDVSLLLSALFIQRGGNFSEIMALDPEVRERRLAALHSARARGATMGEVYAERQALMPERLGNVYYRIYQTSDGYIAVGCLGPEPRRRFREAIGFVDPRYEPGFAADPVALAAAGSALTERCELEFRGRTTAEWLQYLDARDIACGPVRFLDELWEDPGVIANGYIATYEHTLFGPMRGEAPPVQMSATPTSIRSASPALGEHNDAVLAELGFSAREVQEFRAQGVLR